jgi:hypothetical protein
MITRAHNSEAGEWKRQGLREMHRQFQRR